MEKFLWNVCGFGLAAVNVVLFVICVLSGSFWWTVALALVSFGNLIYTKNCPTWL